MLVPIYVFPEIKLCSLVTVYTVKKVREFPVPSRGVTTKLSLGGNNDVITELFLPRGSLVRDIPAGDGKLVNLFYGVFCCSQICGLILGIYKSLTDT